MSEWTERDGGGLRRDVEGLGVVEFYRDTGGMVVDVNGRRAWSAMRIAGAQAWVDDVLEHWEYLYGFKEKRAGEVAGFDFTYAGGEDR